jgi:hypothetical protein
VAYTDCDDAVDADERSAAGREIVAVLAADGAAWVSIRQYEPVAPGRHLLDDREVIRTFHESVGIPSEDGDSIAVDGRRLRVMYADQKKLNHRGYHLEFVADAE